MCVEETLVHAVWVKVGVCVSVVEAMLAHPEPD